MPNDQNHLKKKLDQELSHITFTSQELIRKKTHPKTWRQKLAFLLEKEITIPIVPVGVAALLFLTVSIGPSFLEKQNDEIQRHMIQIGGNYYWSDLFEEVSRK